jgi:hypothetical protein
MLALDLDLDFLWLCLTRFYWLHTLDGDCSLSFALLKIMSLELPSKEIVNEKNVAFQ